MANEKLKHQLLQKGFKPVKKTSQYTLLKSTDGTVLWHRDGHLEGFFPRQVSESLDEVKLRHLMEGLAIIGVAVTYFTTDITIVDGVSMEPTYHNGKILIRSSAAKTVNKMMLNKDAVVKFISPSGDRCIKRILGAPGDEITLIGKDVYLNSKLVDTNNNFNVIKQQQKATGVNKGEKLKQIYTPEIIKLKSGEYYVIGDNRSESIDSREYGPVSHTSIISVIQK